VSLSTVSKFCVCEGLSFKKSLLPAEQDRTIVAHKRQRWKQLQTKLDPRRLVFIDALDQPVNRRSFLQYVRQFLVPTLSPGDLVLMDKLNCHRNVEVRRAIRATGAKLWLLPAYSPDLNPIEQVFAKLKELLRKAAERTFDDLCERLGKLLDEFISVLRSVPTI
jgi:transposase